MSRTNQLPTSIRNIRARLRPFKQPIVWGSLAFLLLLTLCIWEFWQNPDQFLALSIDESSEPAAPNSTAKLDNDARRIATDIDTSDILDKLKPPPAVIHSTQIQPKPPTQNPPQPTSTPEAPGNNLSSQPNSDLVTPPVGAAESRTTANPLNVTSFSDSLLGLSPGVGTNRPSNEAIPPSSYPNNPGTPVWGANSTPPINPLLSAVQQYPIVPPIAYSTGPYTGSAPAIPNYGSLPGINQAPAMPNYGDNYGNNPNTYPVPVLPNYSQNPYAKQQNPWSGHTNNLGQQPSSLPPLQSQQNFSPPVAPFPAGEAPTAFPGQTRAAEDPTRGFAGTNSGSGSPIIPVAPPLDAAPNNAYNYLLQSAPPYTPSSGAVVVPGGVGATGSLTPGSSNPLDGPPNGGVIYNYQNQLVQPSPVPDGAVPNRGMPLSSEDYQQKLE